MNNKFFHFGLIVSFAIHVVLIVSLSITRNEILKKKIKKIELTYYDLKKQANPKQDPVRELKIDQQKKISKDIKLLAKKDSSSQFMKDSLKEPMKLKDKLFSEKKQLLDIKTLDINRKITVPMLKSEKITNPKYLSYNENIRQRIKQRAYLYVNHPDFKAGEVYLTFILAADGQLKEIKIIEEKTNANRYLKEIGLKSIEESNPFPPFPKDLNYPELTFNVVISFEFKE